MYFKKRLKKAEKHFSTDILNIQSKKMQIAVFGKEFKDMSVKELKEVQLRLKADIQKES